MILSGLPPCQMLVLKPDVGPLVRVDVRINLQYNSLFMHGDLASPIERCRTYSPFALYDFFSSTVEVSHPRDELGILVEIGDPH